MQASYARRPLAAALALLPLALTAIPAQAWQAAAQSAAAAPATPTLKMKEIVVSATRTEQDADDTPVSISTISAEQIEREQPTDLEDLLRYETGVSVRAQTNRASAVFRATGRGGNEGINVRGLEGDQVLLQVDGVRLPGGYASGPYQAGRGDTIDAEAYKRVEILRGPSSTQFGSDGLSGAVSFVTKDPADLLTKGQGLQGALKLGYHSVDRSWQTAPSFAFRAGDWQGMVLASVRRGHETANMGTNDVANFNRTAPNPSANRSDYALAKLVYTLARGHEFKLSAETLDRKNDTNVLSFFGDPFTVATLTEVRVSEKITRDMLRADYRYTQPKAAWIQSASVGLYHQDSLNHQFGMEARSTDPKLRTRDTEYSEKVSGGHVQFESIFGADVTHRLVFGLDVSGTDIDSLKEGANSSGAAFVPNKSFPKTRSNLLGAFLQDEIAIGALTLVPGLRFDRFELKPQADALYRVNNTAEPAPLSGSEVSPKLGALWTLDPLATVFAQYAHGFRAPRASQVNGGVTNLTVTSGSGPYTSIGNPDLKPETSNAFEIGLRGRSDALRYSASVFKSKYKNFIASNVLVESNPAPIPDVYKSVNLANVDITGFEARADWALRRDWVLSASYAHARGDSFVNGVATPLDTIEPDKLVLGLRFDRAGRFGGQAMLTAVERKSRNPNPANFTSPGHALLDLSAWVQIGKDTTITAGLYNVFDKKYFQWADVRDVARTTASLDAYSQPGRNLAVSLKHQF